MGTSFGCARHFSDDITVGGKGEYWIALDGAKGITLQYFGVWVSRDGWEEDEMGCHRVWDGEWRDGAAPCFRRCACFGPLSLGRMLILLYIKTQKMLCVIKVIFVCKMHEEMMMP